MYFHKKRFFFFSHVSVIHKKSIISPLLFLFWPSFINILSFFFFPESERGIRLLSVCERMLVGEEGNIYVERTHPAYPFVIDFLVSCCEPVSRTHVVEQYSLNPSALSAATAEGTYSIDIIRCFLTYWQLRGPKRELRLDLERVRAILKAASEAEEGGPPSEGPDETNGEDEVEEAGLGKTYWNSFLRRTANAWWAAVEKTIQSVASTSAVPEKTPPTPKRVLHLASLFQSKTSPPTSSYRPPLPAIHYALSEDKFQASALRAFYNSASHCKGDSESRAWIGAVGEDSELLRAIPPNIEAMLKEEALASKLHIVLQSTTRSTFGLGSSFPSSTFSASNRLPTRRDAEEESEEAYFLVTADRALLERIVEGLGNRRAEWMAPTILGGRERYIISDVRRRTVKVRDPKAAPVFRMDAQDAARVKMLRRMYTTDETMVPSSPAAGRGSALIYKSRLRPGVVRQVREALFNEFGVRADCSYDYLNDNIDDSENKEYAKGKKRISHQDGRSSTSAIARNCGAAIPLHVSGLQLAPGVRLRPYQVAALDRFSRGNLAHQGVVVLPCGAGKTLTGIAAASLLKKRTIVLCINHMSVFQWRREFLQWTTLSKKDVTVCTSKVKQDPGAIVITTYSMLATKRPTTTASPTGTLSASSGRALGAEAQRSAEILEAIEQQTFGLLILDEVHAALAHHYREVVNLIRYKCALGLSATLLREDDRITDLRHLVGPKLYEASWLDLSRSGYLAKVECAEVQCPLPLAYWRRYVELRGDPPSRNREAEKKRERSRRRRFDDSSSSSDSERDDASDSSSGVDWSSDDDDNDETQNQMHPHAMANEGGRRGRRRRGRKRRDRGKSGTPRRGNLLMGPLQTIASCNPVKLWCAQALLHFHLHERSPPDKVLVFCDYLIDANFYAQHLHLPVMEQATSEEERRHLLQWFQHSKEVNALILTRVGDVALDIPNASVVIQVSGLGASRRQEAQRLGRILRPKPLSLDNTCSYFYSLISQDTHEIRSNFMRQSWLRDQGFSYRVLEADQVLRRYRYGSMEEGKAPGAKVKRPVCCVGRPQWWYQVYPREYQFWQQQRQAKEPNDSPSSWKVHATSSSGKYWAPFAAEESMKLQYYFNRGEAQPPLDLQGARMPHYRQLMDSGVSAGRAIQEAVWTVQFSSVNAPEAFGVVSAKYATEGNQEVRTVGEWGSEERDFSTAKEERVDPSSLVTLVLQPRKVTSVLPDLLHDCLSPECENTCLKFSLDAVVVKAEDGTSIG